MEDTTAERIYETLSGLLTEEYRIPGVVNAFDEGKPCAALYEDVMEAYGRLCGRLGAEEEDGDVEIIIDSLLRITRILCLEMYAYGVRFAKTDQ